MSSIKACIFDLDGVIVDTAVYHFKAWKRLADELGINFTEHDNERLKGVSRVRSLEIILELGGVTKTEAEQQELATRKNTWYVEMINRMTPAEILPGAKEFLETCRAAGIKTALGSASKNSGTILDKINMAHLFGAIVDGNHVSKAKPDPEVFLKGAEALGVIPAECVVFEDAIAGVEAAINGGMKVVGIGSPDVLNKADLVVSGLDKMSLEKLNAL
ncbi:beta-phosphoglucomutase [Mucilaginibacter sp. OK098]|uniref:beta-phosphoglucomutase n=1 Tax=Mucilaginibacter sp. OK098 TaxID=1855297 RepID=UPI0009176322|nr:beta-phosphoglucomutase [Mucilaginibacter sp. OK098]SHN01598.1 beta-phosphoglucomutase [Mucilaginibacter sp. OK098]